MYVIVFVTFVSIPFLPFFVLVLFYPCFSNFNAVLFSKPICGSNIKACFGINYIKIVSCVLLLRAVKQTSVLERVKSMCFHIRLFVKSGRGAPRGS